MLNFIYTFFIVLYRVTVALNYPFNPKAKKMIQGRSNWMEPLKKLPKARSKRIWFHTSSLGEFEQGRPVIEALKKEHPEISIVVTFFSPSGYEVRKNYPLADLVMYLPWDSRRNARIFFDLLKPDITIFIKYEFWANFLKEGAKRRIPAILISGIFRPSQVFFRWYGEFFRKILDCFEHLYVQNQQSMDLLASIGVTNTTLAGDTRFDRVKAIAENAESIPEVERFIDSEKVLVAGSVWYDDLKRIIPLINNQGLDIQYIIAPHEINRKEIDSWRREISLESILFSEIDKKPFSKKARVLIIDNIGLLSRLYRYGSYAFIGGAFGPGLHNTLEAVAFGIPVFFGNTNYKKYQEALDLIKIGSAFPIEESAGLKAQLLKFNTEDNFYSKACSNARNYIDQNTGATSSILTYVESKFGQS